MSRRSCARITSWIILVSGASLAFSADVSLDKLPAKAKEALTKLAGSNPIVEIETGKSEGVQVYEAAWQSNGRSIEAKVTGDGALLEMEEGIANAEVPAAVRAAAEKALAGAKEMRFAKITLVRYEAEGVIDGKEHDIMLSPLGTAVNQAGADDDDEDDEDHEDDEREHGDHHGGGHGGDKEKGAEKKNEGK